MGRLLPIDPRPSRAEPEARSTRKEIEKSNPGFSWKTAAVLGMIGVTMLINVEKGVEKCAPRHQRRGEWDRGRSGDGDKGGSGRRRRERSRSRTRARTQTRSPSRERSRSRHRSKSVSFEKASEPGPKQKQRREGHGGSPSRGRRRSSTPGRDDKSQSRSSRRSEG